MNEDPPIDSKLPFPTETLVREPHVTHETSPNQNPNRSIKISKQIKKKQVIKALQIKKKEVVLHRKEFII